MLNEDLVEAVIAPAREERRDFYVYIIYRPNGEPCYVGKGTGDRWKRHATHARKKKHQNKRLERIFELANYDLPIVKVRENLTPEEAAETEIAFIAAIGRENKKLGPLVNYTDGGEGQWGWIPSNEMRQKISMHRKGKKQPREAVEKTAAKNRGRKFSSESIAKRVAKVIGQKRSSESRERMRRAQKIRREKGEAAPVSLAFKQSHKGKYWWYNAHGEAYRASSPRDLSDKRGRIFAPEHKAALSVAMTGKKRGKYKSSTAPGSPSLFPNP